MTRRHWGDLPPDEPIQLSFAHLVVDRSRSTVYGWVQRGILDATDTPDGMTVTPAQVRAAEARVKRGRPAVRRVIEKAGQREIESPVD